MQAAEQTQRPIAWYRTPLDPGDFKSLHARSDWQGALQSVSYLGLMLLTGSAAFHAAGRCSAVVVLALVFLHGIVCSFLINAVHELGHGTVFRTKFLNALFVRIFAFLGWINFEMFNTSHARHHRYTLHAPDDLEVVLPLKVMVKDFFKQGFFNPMGFYHTLKNTIRVARGDFKGKWELALFVEGTPERRAAIHWARTLLAGHGLILVASLYFHLWMLPVVTTLCTFYGGWLFFLCNNTQHIGLQDDVPDFRLCCRTFTMNPFCQFLYWHMNYHTEHHMYAAVPCYKLVRLHQLIKHDLPPCPHGLVATWKEIATIQAIQKMNPAYEHIALLPHDPRALGNRATGALS